MFSTRLFFSYPFFKPRMVPYLAWTFHHSQSHRGSARHGLVPEHPERRARDPAPSDGFWNGVEGQFARERDIRATEHGKPVKNFFFFLLFLISTPPPATP